MQRCLRQNRVWNEVERRESGFKCSRYGLRCDFSIFGVVEDCGVFTYGVVVGTDGHQVGRPRPLGQIRLEPSDTVLQTPTLFLFCSKGKTALYSYSRQSQSQCQNERQTIWVKLHL
jgi:hypothetical protein